MTRARSAGDGREGRDGQPLGDPHNFGRRVTARGARIVKPRSLLWEWLLLSAKSPLRRALAHVGESEWVGRDAFDFLPDLAFDAPESQAGAVERVSLAPLGRSSEKQKRHLAEITGRAIALFSWLGLADLHWENLVLGEDRRGHVVFAPLDVEMILDDLSLPTETKLLPDADPEVAAVCRHAAGVRRVLPYLGKPVDPALVVAIAGAYRATLDALDRHAKTIASALAALPTLRDAPIRVLLRGTDEYVRARSEPVWPPLLDGEAEQLARGDIPYFFRFYGRAGIYYYADEALSELSRLPLRGDVPKLEPLLSITRGLTSPSRRTLREQGLFTVLGAFDQPGIRGAYAANPLTVTFRARSVSVTLASGEELEASRDMRAFVGSVYLPCRCGEVRSVFVPTRTTCRATR